MIYLVLIFVFARIGLFTFGGGYAMLPLVSREVVHTYNWLTSPELVDMVAISQLSPGPLSVNLATFIGFDQAGLPGAVAATFGIVFFTALLSLMAARTMINHPDHPVVKGIFTGLRPAVISFIAAAALALFPVSVIDLKTLLLLFAALVAYGKLNIPPIPLILSSGLISVLFFG